MSLLLVLAVAWFVLALVGWLWLVAAARADRALREQPQRSPHA
jgi:hypothetical protein